MKRLRGDDIEDLEATEQAVRRRPHQPSGSTNPLADEASTGRMFEGHSHMQATLIRDSFARSDIRLFGQRANGQGRSSSSAEIGDVDHDGGSSRPTIMRDLADSAGSVDSPEAIPFGRFTSRREVKESMAAYLTARCRAQVTDPYPFRCGSRLHECENFFTRVFSRHLGLGRPCESLDTAFAHAEIIYHSLSRILKDYEPRQVMLVFVMILDKRNPEMAPLSPRGDSGTAAAASASAARIPVGPLPPPPD